MLALVGQSVSTGTADWAYQLGAFGTALAVAWWLLGRSDREIQSERNESAIEVARLTAMLLAEQAAHEETRQLLFEELRRNHNGGTR